MPYSVRLMALVLLVIGARAFADAGDADSGFGVSDLGFGIGSGANAEVLSITQQSDGKIVISGYFTAYSNVARYKTARINLDGSIDPTLVPVNNGPLQDSQVMAVQPDGKILLGGNFTHWNGNVGTGYGIDRINADGSLDTSFTSWSGVTANGVVNWKGIALQPDGKIIIGGGFAGKNIARLNSDGTTDNTFSATTDSAMVEAVTLQPDGKILVGGFFGKIDGVARNNIGRINSNGSLDTSFAVGTGANNVVLAFALQTDGKIIAAGSFTSYNGTPASHIIRLNSDGSIDNTFAPPGFNSDVTSLKILPSGKIVVVGFFTGGIVQLNVDGSVDTSFNVGSGASDGVRDVAIQSDGKLLVAGRFTSFNGVSMNRVVRLFPDGTLDRGQGSNGHIHKTRCQQDGNIIVAGDFTRINGVMRNRIARLDQAGNVDATFNPGDGANDVVFSSAIQQDGKVIAAGDFTSFNGTASGRIVRLNSDGSRDSGFNPGTGADKTIYAAALQSDGKILVGGSFVNYNGATANRITRINSDGSLDADFSNSGVATNGDVRVIAVQQDGRILIGGYFTSVKGVSRKYLARLNSDGTVDSGFNTGSGLDGGVLDIQVLADNRIVIGGEFVTINGSSRKYVARLQADGTLDTGFDSSSAANARVQTVSIQQDGKAIIGGDFSSVSGSGRNRLARLNSDGSLDNTFVPGGGADDSVTASAIQSDGKILISGAFNDYGSVATTNIARVLSVTGAGPDTDGDGVPDSQDCYPTDNTKSVCMPGTYPTGTGFDYAPAGSYAINGVLAQCAAGTFTSTIGNSSCTPAPVGSYVSDPGATSATQCAAGTFQSGTGASSCNSCPALTYSNAGSATCHIKARGDFDNTGISDVLMRNSSSGSWQSFLLSNAAVASTASLGIDANPDTQYMATMDANGDGSADVLTRSASTGVWSISTVVNNVVTNTQAVTMMTTDPNWQFQGVADFNGDGTDDILIRHTTGYWFVYFLKNGQVWDWGGCACYLSADLQFRASGDMTGDGVADVLFRSVSTGTWYVFNGATSVVTVPALYLSSDWQFQALADLNGDGIQDVILRITSPASPNAGLWGAFIMNSSGAVASSYVMSSVWMNLANQFVASGDYNGDGTGDLLIRNTNTGTYYIFTTNPPGATSPGQQTLATAPTLNATPWGVLK